MKKIFNESHKLVYFIILAFLAFDDLINLPLAMQDISVRVTEQEFGKTPDGQTVIVYTLENSNSTKVRIITYGATIIELRTRDRSGRLANIVLGTDSLSHYLNGFPAAASVIGRVANRISNASFTLDGKVYKLVANNGTNHIHGGIKNFSKVVWNGRILKQNNDSATIEMTYQSPDGEEGYPGNLKVSVRYSLTKDNELIIEYEATTDKPTPVNLTNHAYFNLSGFGNVLSQELWLSAQMYTPTDKSLIPTGEIKPVKDTPLDFSKPTPIGARIDQLKEWPGGYDHNYVLPDWNNELKLFAKAYDPASGRTLEAYTTEPGVQLYTANHLNGQHKGIDGITYVKYGGFCLETQHFPDSLNKTKFPSIILRPNNTYRSTTIYKFSVK